MQTKQDLQEAVLLHLNNAGHTTSSFARDLGVSRQVVSKWLTTSCVTYDKLFELMKALGYEVHVFVQKEGDE
jgi:predicted XRE-type DNA-binding protein